MIDAGAITYFSIVKDLAHVAGVYDVNDWMMVDERAERFRPLFNDEYSRDALVGLCIGTHTSHRLERIHDDAALERAAASLFADPLFGASRRRLHADCAGRSIPAFEPSAPEARPLQHDARRDRPRGIQSAGARSAPAGRSIRNTATSARPGSNITPANALADETSTRSSKAIAPAEGQGLRTSSAPISRKSALSSRGAGGTEAHADRQP